MAEERELILKLGQKITDRIGVKVTTKDPEYWGLAGVITDEMAEVALSMKVRVPATAPQIAKKCGKSLERTEELLQEMSVIGLIEYNWENKDHVKQYILPMFVPGCAEFMMMNEKQVEEHPELADFFENMSRLPLEKITPMVPLGGAGIGMHVIPVEQAIPATQQSVSVEHISYWLKKYENKYAVGACSCRRQQRVRGEGTGEIEGELCIGVGDMADYLVETGKGRYIDLNEVLEILQRAEDNGFVHQITNIDGEDKIFAICNCAPGVCNALRTSQLRHKYTELFFMEKEKVIKIMEEIISYLKLNPKQFAESLGFDRPQAIYVSMWSARRFRRGASSAKARKKAAFACQATR